MTWEAKGQVDPEEAKDHALLPPTDRRDFKQLPMVQETQNQWLRLDAVPSQDQFAQPRTLMQPGLFTFGTHWSLQWDCRGGRMDCNPEIQHSPALRRVKVSPIAWARAPKTDPGRARQADPRESPKSWCQQERKENVWSFVGAARQTSGPAWTREGSCSEEQSSIGERVPRSPAQGREGPQAQGGEGPVPTRGWVGPETTGRDGPRAQTHAREAGVGEGLPPKDARRKWKEQNLAVMVILKQGLWKTL